jgi:hypothetical protein
LAGAPEVGKSFLALNIMIGLALQEPSASFVYLALDDSPDRFLSRMDALLKGEGKEPLNIKYITQADSWPRMGKSEADEDGLTKLVEGLNLLPNPRLVVIDTLTHFLPECGKDGFGYNRESNILTRIRKLTTQFEGLNILATTHLDKGEHKNIFDGIYGTKGGMRGATDAQMCLLREGDRADLKIQGNDLPDCITSLTWDPKALAWSKGQCSASGEKDYQDKDAKFQEAAQSGGSSKGKSKRKKPGPEPVVSVAAMKMGQILFDKGINRPNAWKEEMERQGFTGSTIRAAREKLFNGRDKDGVYLLRTPNNINSNSVADVVVNVFD